MNVLSKILVIVILCACTMSAVAQKAGEGAAFTSETYSDTEKNSVSAPTRGLFAGRDKFVIDFSACTSRDWCYPLRNGKVISPFGGARRNHKGVDIKTFAGDTIYAAFDGRVRFSKPFSGYGNAIVLRHDMGFETLYSHNKKNLVAFGDYVRAGQPIAIMGRTGRATTEHCHFEIRINGKAYDPNRFFNCSTRRLRSEKVIVYKSGKLTFISCPKEEIKELPVKQ